MTSETDRESGRAERHTELLEGLVGAHFMKYIFFSKVP
jgi:hypothetical protein